MARVVAPAAILFIAACTPTSPTPAPAPTMAAAWPPVSVASSGGGELAAGSLLNASVAVIPRGREAPVLVGAGPVPARSEFLVPSGLAYGDDGTLFVVDTGGRGISAVRADGSAQPVPLAAPDGSDVELSYPTGLAVAPDGTLWLSDTTAHRVLRIDPQGRATVAVGAAEGRLEPSFAGDGGPGTEARLAYPGGVALGPDGSLYIADGGNRRVRRLLPDGTIETVAGNGRRRFSGDGGPATEAGIGSPRGVAVDRDGNLYFTAAHRLRRVSRGGTITTVAGMDRRGCAGDGGPATDARLSLPIGVAIGPGGVVYVADHQNHLIRAVTPEGTILTAVAMGDPPSRACLSTP